MALPHLSLQDAVPHNFVPCSPTCLCLAAGRRTAGTTLAPGGPTVARRRQEQCCPVWRAPGQCCSCCRLQQPLWGWDCSWTMGRAVQTQAGCFACAGGAEQRGMRFQDASGSNTSRFPDGAQQVAFPGRSLVVREKPGHFWMAPL